MKRRTFYEIREQTAKWIGFNYNHRYKKVLHLQNKKMGEIHKEAEAIKTKMLAILEEEFTDEELRICDAIYISTDGPNILCNVHTDPWYIKEMMEETVTDVLDTPLCWGPNEFEEVLD